MEPILGQTKKFTLPDGNWAEIREQNGSDDDILSNPVKSRDLTNFSEFISAIVINSSWGKLTEEAASNLPLNVRYCILINSRIFSLGEILEFSYNWGGNIGVVNYEQDLNELLYDYSSVEEMELANKPYAIPFYPNSSLRELYLTTSTGKSLSYKLFTGKGEQFLLNTPKEKRTKNIELMCRELSLSVNGIYEKVENFSSFTAREMLEIRKSVTENDPVYLGKIPLDDTQGGSMLFDIFGIPDFFYPGGF